MRNSTADTCLLASCALIFGMTACSDTSDPLWPPATAKVAATLVALTPTTLTDVVGNSPNDVPAVMTLDANGDPLSGITVRFVVVSGGGYIHHNGQDASGLVLSNDAGIATVPGWRFGLVPGTNRITASTGSLPPVSFTVITSPGTVHVPVKLAGDHEVAAPGTHVGSAPAIRVTDQFGNSVTGVPVSFTVSRGGGSLTGANVLTDSLGIAAVSSWTLGSIGEQEVEATYPGNTHWLVFRAVAKENLDISCPGPEVLDPGDSWTMSLPYTRCLTPSGRPYNLYTVDIAQFGQYHFSASSTSFATYIELFDSTGAPVARPERADNKSTIYAFLPKGRYTLSVTSISPGFAGDYLVWSGTTSQFGCAVPAVASGVELHARMGTCSVNIWNSPADKYQMHLTAGQSVTLRLDYGDGFMEPALSVTNASGTPFASTYSNVYGAKSLSLTYVAAKEGFYTIVVGELPAGFSYVLSVK